MQKYPIGEIALAVTTGPFFPEFPALRPNIHRKKAVWASTMPIITTHIGQAGIEMNWEIDVFGNIRKGAKAQKNITRFTGGLPGYNGLARLRSGDGLYPSAHLPATTGSCP